MTRFEKLTQSPETLAAYIEGLVCYLLEDARVALREYYIRLKEARQSKNKEDKVEYLKLAEEAHKEYEKAYAGYKELVKIKKEKKA